MGTFSYDELLKTVEYFDYKCPYTGQDISVEFKTGAWVLDHLIPHNRESCGLNLYGNLIVTTKKINGKKAAKSYEDFIRHGTEGTQEEKENRIKKLRTFQEESGYFRTIKNIDEIKKLCQSEYDFIQKRLKEHFSEYERLTGSVRENPAVKTIPPSRYTAGAKSSTGGISKTEAIQLCRRNGCAVQGNITFASLNSGTPAYWANPQLDYIRRDWHLILNDTDKRILYLFFIPAHTIATENVTVRADKPQLIDIQINYGDDKFQDKRSGLYFYKWLKKTLRY